MRIHHPLRRLPRSSKKIRLKAGSSGKGAGPRFPAFPPRTCVVTAYLMVRFRASMRLPTACSRAVTTLA